MNVPIYRDIYDGPPRSHGGGRTSKRWITIHCTQNTASAAGEASYAKRRPDSVSSHYYVDGQRLVQSLDTDLRAHHVGSTVGNNGGISYEITGLISWSRPKWMGSVAWDLLGAAIARDCAEHDIPARLCTVADLRAGRGGIMTHNQARLAWGGTSHTDPGDNFPMDHLLATVEGDVALSNEDIDKVAKAVYDMFTHTVRETDYAAKRGWQAPGTQILPRKGLQYGWGYSKGNYIRLGEALKELATVRAEVASVRELVSGLAAHPELALSDEQVQQLAVAVQQAGDAAGRAVLERLEAAGEALAGDDDPDD